MAGLKTALVTVPGIGICVDSDGAVADRAALICSTSLAALGVEGRLVDRAVDVGAMPVIGASVSTVVSGSKVSASMKLTPSRRGRRPAALPDSTDARPGRRRSIFWPTSSSRRGTRHRATVPVAAGELGAELVDVLAGERGQVRDSVSSVGHLAHVDDEPLAGVDAGRRRRRRAQSFGPPWRR